jgi:hypothetical protein
MNDMEFTEEPDRGPAAYKPVSKTIEYENDEWKDANGHHLTLCAIHEMKLGAETTKQAVSILGGIAVCREHFDHMVADLRLGKPTTAIIMEALAGEY